MIGDINDAILRLRSDAGDLPFTGYLTNAHVEDPPSVKGEIWRHIRAEPSGKFADGHRVETSRMVEIEVRGESMWVVTEQGSRYGILSISPIGWIYFSSILRINERLNPAPAQTPRFIMDLQAVDLPLPELRGLRMRSPKQPDPAAVANSSSIRRVLDPSAQPPEVESTERLIEALKRNGVRFVTH